MREMERKTITYRVTISFYSKVNERGFIGEHERLQQLEALVRKKLSQEVDFMMGCHRSHFKEISGFQSNAKPED